MQKLNPGPCAKKTVWAMLVTKDDEVFLGLNLCRNAQNVCPREGGEGYDKCETVCQTLGHAEELALEMAGDKARGGHMYIGHHRVCITCQSKMFHANVTFETVEAREKRNNRPNSTRAGQ